MKKSIRILLVLGVIMGVIPIAASAIPITDGDVSIDFIIDDGNPADLHDDNGWLVAGSGVSSTIRVTYIGSDSPVIQYVKFTSVEKETYGDVTGTPLTSMPYEGVFSASKNVAGYAPILVQINYTANETGYDYYRTVYQPIDSNIPMRIQNITFESEVTLDETMDITVVMEDVYGNTVTSLYEDDIGGTAESVTFETTQYAGSGFYDGTGYDAELLNVPVNADGTVVVTFKVGTESGPKYLIHLVPDLALDDKWLTITALADGKPYSINVSVVPNTANPPYVPADGESQFFLTYNLRDKYGNPSGNQTISFTDDIIGDTFTQRTNSDGQIMISFGPFGLMGTYTIHAEAMENTSVVIDQVVKFTNTSPDNMLLTASPQSMPSADVATSTGAELYAKVMDENGNGVAGESVSFFLLAPGSGYSLANTTDPFLDDPQTATTNEDGIASMHFTPGAFVTDYNDAKYNPTASDSCKILATWGTKTRTIDLEWKNYPYLRVETEVSPATVEVGDPVDVTVRLIGDGWALQPDPIDVMLCADRSGSMSKGWPISRINSLKNALKIFNAEMSPARDMVGLTSFGYSGRQDLAFTPGGSEEVDNAIDSLYASGYTAMRDGLHIAINDVRNGRPGAVKAVILLSDGDFNYYGDPLARGGSHTYTYKWYSCTYEYYKYNDLSSDEENFEQNLSVYANNYNIPIYSIALGNGLSYTGNSTLKKIASSTGGKYYFAPSGDDLAAIYLDIAGELMNEAGVNTEMDVMFSNVELNNVSQANDAGDPILEYEYEDGVSTLVKSWNTTGSEDSPNIILPWTLDQRNDWNDNRSLNFETSEIGTIHLNQTWQAVFRMNVLKPGNINIFGDGSAIFFNNGTDSLDLPKTYITAVDNLTATGINFTGLQVSDLVCVETENGEVIETDLTLNWNLNYSGTFTTTQYLYYQKVGDGIWINCGEVEVTGPVSTLAQSSQLYVRDFPPGEYKLRVRAMAPDAPDSVIETLQTVLIGQADMPFIRLE